MNDKALQPDGELMSDLRWVEPIPLIEAAREAHSAQQWSDAAELWESVRGWAPNSTEGYVKGGEALRNMGNFDDAEALLEEATERFPQDLWANVIYATIATHRRDWIEALHRHTAIRERFPSAPDGYAGSGVALCELGRYDDADALLSLATEKFPDNFWVHYHHAQVSAYRRDWPETTRRLSLVADQFPNNPEIYLGLGNAAFAGGDSTRSDEVLSSAVSRFPHHSALAVRWASLASTREAWEKALMRWQAVRTQFPREPLAHCGVVEALSHLGRSADALNEIECSLEILKKNETLAAFRARILAENATPQEFMKSWQNFLCIHPNPRETFLLPHGLGKADGVLRLANRLGLQINNAWASPAVGNDIARICSILGSVSNNDIKFINHSELSDLNEHIIHPTMPRNLPSPRFANSKHFVFAHIKDDTFSLPTPEFNILTVKDGYICHFSEAPIVFHSDGRTVIADYSSNYAKLLYFYDKSVKEGLEKARYVDGLVIPIADDVRPLNFCHWLIDWLPRLEALGSRCREDDVFVVTSPLIAPFQRETLRLCGFSDDRIIGLKNYEAVQARELFVPSNLAIPHHPGFHAAPWALSFLRLTVGAAALDSNENVKKFDKIYISRRDTGTRCVANEEDLLTSLAAAGFKSVVLSGLSMAEQVQMFATASHVVSVHGAGLTNFVFSPSDARLLEIFPKTYGTAAYSTIAAGMNKQYLSYVANDIVPGSRSQLDDMRIDIVDFKRQCMEYCG